MKQDILGPLLAAGIHDVDIIRSVLNIALASVHDSKVFSEVMELASLDDSGLRVAIQQKLGGR
jgi:hypothetical protein